MGSEMCIRDSNIRVYIVNYSDKFLLIGIKAFPELLIIKDNKVIIDQIISLPQNLTLNPKSEILIVDLKITIPSSSRILLIFNESCIKILSEKKIEDLGLEKPTILRRSSRFTYALNTETLPQQENNFLENFTGIYRLTSTYYPPAYSIGLYKQTYHHLYNNLTNTELESIGISNISITNGTSAVMWNPHEILLALLIVLATLVISRSIIKIMLAKTR